MQKLLGYLALAKENYEEIRVYLNTLIFIRKRIKIKCAWNIFICKILYAWPVFSLAHCPYIKLILINLS